MQDYKSLRLVIIISATLVSTHTHTNRQTAFDQSYTISSAIWAKS